MSGTIKQIYHTNFTLTVCADLVQYWYWILVSLSSFCPVQYWVQYWCAEPGIAQACHMEEENQQQRNNRKYVCRRTQEQLNKTLVREPHERELIPERLIFAKLKEHVSHQLNFDCGLRFGIVLVLGIGMAQELLSSIVFF